MILHKLFLSSNSFLEKTLKHHCHFMDSINNVALLGKERAKGNGCRSCTGKSEENLAKLNIITLPLSSSMGRHCLCDTIKPILGLAQTFGLIPLSLEHVRNKEKGLEKKLGDCELVFHWKSPAVIVNSLLITFFAIILPFARSEIRDRMSVVFSGTDLYAFTFQTLAMVLETTALLTFGRIYKGKFAKGWKSLNDVFHATCDSADDLRKIKIGCYIVFLFTLLEGVCFFAFMYMTSLQSIGVYQSCIALLSGTTIITLTLLIPYIVSTLFLFICLLIRSHFMKISEMLATILTKNKSSAKLFNKIDSMRVLHEQLCSTVTHFEDFFGLQVLLTLCTCCFTITVGAYATILQGEGISSPKGRELSGAWGMQLYCATIFLLLILISGQLVSNAAASAAPVLNRVSLTELDEKSQQQILAFLHKISAFPCKMRAVNITSISTTFLASATTNIITYLLVLMQFKLSLENWYGNLNNNVTETETEEMTSYFSPTTPSNLSNEEEHR